MENRTYDELEVERDKVFKFIENFIIDYCDDESDRAEVFSKLAELIDFEIRLERFCNV